VLPQAWNFAVGVHFAHRAMAAMLVMVIGLFALAVWRERTASVLLRRTAVVMVALVGLQLILGIAVIWTLRDPFYTTAHVVAGAGTLAATFLLTWFCYRNRIESACTGDRGRERRPVRPRERIGDESGGDALKPRPAVTARAGVLRG
jgi:cytochrome c oxidase assembly protein subunit 15